MAGFLKGRSNSHQQLGEEERIELAGQQVLGCNTIREVSLEVLSRSRGLQLDMVYLCLWNRKEGLGIFYYAEMMTIMVDGCAHSDLNTTQCTHA